MIKREAFKMYLKPGCEAENPDSNILKKYKI
jgi:hypothetical protein